jgi:hypothetical protein
MDAGLGNVEMLIEYQLPLTSRRADVVLAGVDRRTGGDAYVVVELKQWSQAELYEDSERLVVVEGMHRVLEHPLLQVQGYCDYISGFVASLRGNDAAVRGVAYLHNATDLDAEDLFEFTTTERTRLFTKSRRGAFLEYLRDQFTQDPGSGAADRLLTSAIRPSRQLMKLAASEIKDREQFTLLDEQRLAFEIVMHAVEKARRSDAKEVVVITGGPGSGKSVIALSLLGELNRQGYATLHATGSRSFTQTMRRHVGRGAPRVKDLFKYFNSFMDAQRNDIEVLICDEAHRIRETSANRYTSAAQRTGRSQIDELIAAARVPVFLLDEHQVVKPGEVGTVEAIKSHASSLGFRVHHVQLDDQFRCGGSRKYERWVLRLLAFETGGPEPWTGDDHFEVTLADSPWEMENILRGKLAEGYSARVSAGYCWPWSNPGGDGRLVNDVRVGDWAMPWNVKGDRASAQCALGDHGGRFRPGWLRLHGSRIRVRLVGRDHRSRLDRSPGPDDYRTGSQQGPGIQETVSHRPAVRPTHPKHLQSTAHPRNGGNSHLCSRSPDPGIPRRTDRNHDVTDGTCTGNQPSRCCCQPHCPAVIRGLSRTVKSV